MSRKSKAALLLLSLAAAALAAAVSFRPAASGRRLVVVFTKELRGHVAPCGCYPGQPGGIARLGAAAGPDFGAADRIYVDAGDFVGNPPVRGLDGPKANVEIGPAKLRYLRSKQDALAFALGKLGLAAACPGEMDFLLGQSFLLEGMRNPVKGPAIWKGVRNPLVCANVEVAGGGTLFPPFRIVDVGRGSVAGFKYGGIKAGIMGIAAANVRLPSRSDDMYALEITDPVRAARDSTAKMRELGADVVIALFHGKIEDAISLMNSVPGIHLAVVGHGGASRPPLKAGDGWVVQVTGGGVEAGMAVLTLEGGRVTAVDFEARVLKPELPEDQEVLAGYRAFQAALAAEPVKPVFLSDPGGAYAGHERCASCHESQWRQWSGTPHFRAFETLVSRFHSGDPECLQCHTTGFGDETGFTTPGEKPGLSGVGCEACHGPRQEHCLEWEARKDGGDMPKPEAGPGTLRGNCVRCHDDARDPGFHANFETKRLPRVRHR